MQRQMPFPGIIFLYSHPGSPRPNFSICAGFAGGDPARLGITQVDRLIQEFLDQGIAKSTPIRLAAVQPILQQTQSTPTPAHRTHPMPVRSSDGPDSLMRNHLGLSQCITLFCWPPRPIPSSLSPPNMC